MFIKPVFYILIIFISGCMASSTAERPTTPESPTSIIKGETLPGSIGVAGRIRTGETKKKTIPGSRMTYSQITDLIGEFLEIRSTGSVFGGEPMFLGTSEANLVTLEIIGEKDNVSQASMKLIYPKDIQVVDADLNNAMMLRFLKNIAPEFEEWPSRVKEIMDRFSSMQAGNRDGDNITLGEKIIQISYDKNKNVDSIIVTVKLR